MGVNGCQSQPAWGLQQGWAREGLLGCKSGCLVYTLHFPLKALCSTWSWGEVVWFAGYGLVMTPGVEKEYNAKLYYGMYYFAFTAFIFFLSSHYETSLYAHQDCPSTSGPGTTHTLWYSPHFVLWPFMVSYYLNHLTIDMVEKADFIVLSIRYQNKRNFHMGCM